MVPETELQEGSSSALDVASRAFASLAPLRVINQHLCGFHVYAQDHTRQLEVHHLCSHKKSDFYQCIIYDSEADDARLIGIEYIVSENVFRSLPEEEKKYWHSHKYEVESGLLYLETVRLVPNAMNDALEKSVMQGLQKTYGKTVHTWAIDKHPDLPIGPPQLMMSVTRDGQLNEHVAKERDDRLGISTDRKKELRNGYLDKYEKNKLADQWERSQTGITFEPKEVNLQAK